VRFKKELKNISLTPLGCLTFRRLLMALVIPLIIIQHSPAFAAPDAGPVTDAAKRLIRFCADPQTGLDTKDLTTLIDYVLGPKVKKETGLPEFDECPGAYYEFDTKITFPRFLSYSYNPKIPPVITGPSSMRYSMWTSLHEKSQNLLEKWKPAFPGDKPVVIHGVQRDGITPDLTTGVYYEYDLKRTLIHLNYKGRLALISISKQMRQSDIGKKGLIIGSDDDWNYYYSGETGSYKTGLGWVKSYIYDYYSLGVYVETGASSNAVRSGNFQWLRAGWSGMNFVKTDHILKGMKRFARNSKSILESKNLPAPSRIVKHYQLLSALPIRDLNERYAALQKAQHSIAVKTGKIGTSEPKGQGPYNNISKEQIVQELMLEYLKVSLGKQSFLGKNF
jgi:hypothetical protein